MVNWKSDRHIYWTEKLTVLFSYYAGQLPVVLLSLRETITAIIPYTMQVRQKYGDNSGGAASRTESEGGEKMPTDTTDLV